MGKLHNNIKNTLSTSQVRGPGSIHKMGGVILAFGEPALFTGETGHLHVEEAYLGQNLSGA